jgi:hypothetical protein
MGYHIALTGLGDLDLRPRQRHLHLRNPQDGVQRWRPTMHHPYEYGTSVTLLGRKTKATKVVNGDL